MIGWLRGLAFRVRGLWRADAVHDEIDEELRFHVDMRAEENVRRGMDPEDARRDAERRLGGLARMEQRGYDVRGGRWLEDTVQDMRYGFRALARNLGFTVVAVLTLGLGIGANTAVFSVINAVLLRPLPYHEPERLVVVWEDASFIGYPHNNPTPANFLDLRANNTVFEDMGALGMRDFSLTGDGDAARISALRVTANLIPLTGVQPLLGRGFLAEEDQAGGPKAVLLGHGLWQTRYGGADGVVGREILLDGEPYRVIGVMPPGFQLVDRRADVWVPMAFGPEDATNRGSHYLVTLARLKPGVTVEQAQSEMQAMMEGIARQYPEQADRLGAAVVPLREQVAGEARTPLLVLLVAVAFVLLITCINVGNLMLSRAAARSREVAVRAALGASRGRMLRQLLVENVPLVICGNVVGLLFAYWSLGFLRQLIPRGLAQSTELGLDLRVLGFTLVVALAATALFGLFPAFQALKVDLNEALRSGSARAGFSAGGRLQSALVVGQVCLAIALLVGASLLIQTFFHLRDQYSDMQVASVLTMKTVLSRTAYDTHEKREAFFEQTVERARALPGVVAVGYTNALPLDYRGDSTGFTIEGTAPNPTEKTNANTRLVSPDYLKALGIPVRQGRHFADSDGPDSELVVVVNETMAKQYLPGQDPVGRRLKIGGPQSETPWAKIVGVAADVRQRTVDEPAYAEIYFLYRQFGLEVFAPKTLAIRTSRDQGAIVAAMRKEIAAIDPNQPVSDVKTMDDVLGEQTSSRRLGVLLLGAFAAVALALASIGVYGLLSQRVAQMTPEIGVRLALGARPRDVVAMIVGRGMRLVTIGTVVGLALAFGLSRLITSQLFGVSAVDPLTFVGVPAVLVVVALVACYVPARRAASVDPNVALKYE
jgi:putative ABC transport system permease protein